LAGKVPVVTEHRSFLWDILYNYRWTVWWRWYATWDS